MNWDAFHEKAKRAIPPQEELDPKRYWVGILNAEVSPEGEVAELDFVWVKGHRVSQSVLDKLCY
jgi:hypothetical protein